MSDLPSTSDKSSTSDRPSRSDRPESKRRPGQRRGAPAVARSYHELARWALAWLREQLGNDAELPAIDLDIRLPVRAAQGDRRRALRDFEASLERALKQASRGLAEARQGFHDGHVWCHWCSQPACEPNEPCCWP